MDRPETIVVGRTLAMLLLLGGGCSGGTSLQGDGDRDGVPPTDTGDDGTCPPTALSRGSCTATDPPCRTAVFCQQCARDAWALRSASCWCTDGSWVCDHWDCRPPYWGAYVDPECMVPWGADADADGDGGTEIDDGDIADGAVDAGGCVDGWCDPTSGLCWQDPPPPWPDPSSLLTWHEAGEYCDALDLGGCGAGSWRLPTIDELRSLVRGCPDTEAGGSCRVIDGCLDDACWDLSCAGCPESGGPGSREAYWPREISGARAWYWSSSVHVDGGNAWNVHFNQGCVGYYYLTAALHVRCVRPGP